MPAPTLPFCPTAHVLQNDRPRYQIIKETPDAEQIPLRLNDVAVSAATLNGKPALLTVKKRSYLLALRGQGRYELLLTLKPRLQTKGETLWFQLPVIPVATATLSMTHDRTGHEVLTIFIL